MYSVCLITSFVLPIMRWAALNVGQRGQLHMNANSLL